MSLIKSQKPYESAEGSANTTALLLGQMDIAELLLLRAEIDVLLPATALKDMDLEEELVIQYQTLKSMQKDVLDDESIPANQRAQVANAVGSTLQSLMKMQSDVYSSERFKKLETSLIHLLNEWPEDQTLKFFERYEAIDV